MLRHASALFYTLILFSMNSHAYETYSSFDNDTAAIKVLVFLSKDCPCSRSHVQHLNELSDSFKTAHFYGVISDPIESSTKASIGSYFNSQTFRFSVISDPEQKLIKAYQALKTPHVTVLKRQPNGLYTQIYEGGVTDHRDFPQAKKFFLKENLTALSQQKPLPYTAGKSLGCYIRRL